MRARSTRQIRPQLALGGLVILWLGAWCGALAPAAFAQQEPIVAVFPFRVHSAKPIDYLGESLSNLLRSRLEATGRVVVLDPVTVEGQLDESQLGETRDGALRELAGRIGAAYVVSGSLTELAGHYSLDVRVTPQASGVRGDTLVLTADRDDELLDRVGEVADGVVAFVAGAGPSEVIAVTLEGAYDREAELAERLRTRVGETFDPATVRDDLDMLRGVPVVASAEVATVRSPEGVSVAFKVIRAERLGTAGSAQAGPDRVAEVQIRGNRRIEAAAIKARIATREGRPYRPLQVARDIREINALGFFRNVRVLTDRTPQGLVVIFEVEENPVVREISISGNENVDGDQIRDILTLTTGSTLDYPLLFENRERIAVLYRAQGYYLAEVNYEVETLSEHSVGIHFVVDENKKLKLRKIDFVGNERFTDRELRQGFQTKLWHWWSYATSWLDRSGTYAEPLFLQDLRSVEKKYADAGYLQIEVSPPEVIPSPDGLEVIVRIKEGRVFAVGEIDVQGDETVDVDKLKRKLLIKEGEVFNRTALSDSVTLLNEHYQDQGFYFARVTPLSNMSSQQDVVDIIFQVEKGPLYFIREIDISGNTVTVDPVVRREMQLVEGELYSQRKLMLSRLRIERLGFFEQVDLQMEPTEVPEQLDAEVTVVERPTGSFSFGAGFSSQDGFVGTGSLQQSNLFGRGYAVNASVDFGGQTQRFFLSLTDPYFLGSDFSLGVTAFYTSLEFESFDQETLGAEAVLGHSLSEDNRTRGFLRYSYARRRIADDTRITAASLIFRELFAGTLDTSLLGLSLVSDTRNDRFAATKGWNIGLSVEGAGPLGFANFLRTEGRVQWYLGAPWWMPERSTFVVGARVGYALPFNSIGDFDLPSGPGIPTDGSVRPLEQIDTNLKLPLSERYFLGGLGQFQLRGFRARSVGPRRPILYSPSPGLFTPVGRQLATVDKDTGDPVPPGSPDSVLGTICVDDGRSFGNGNGVCNELDDVVLDEEETDVIGGNKFISASFEYRFPISQTLGLQGLVFFDTGNAFGEGDNLFDLSEWRYGTGFGVQWFSPFGPLAVILGFPLDRIESLEDSPVVEFSVGGRDF